MSRDDWYAAGTSVLLHALVLFGGAGLLVEQTQFGMLAGGSSGGASAPQNSEVQAELVEPPQQEPPVVQQPPEPPHPEDIPEPQREEPKPRPPSSPRPNLRPRSAASRLAVGQGRGAGKGAGSTAGSGSGVSGAAYLYNPPPPYPPSAQAEGREGRVILRVRVSAQGLPVSVVVERSSGYRDLDESACHCVRRCWRFRPMRVAGIPVESEVTVPIRFELRRG
jgi:protein TonB